MAVSRNSAHINQQIELKIQFRYDQTGELFDVYAINKVEIIDASTDVILETIQSADVIRLSTGFYKVITDAAWNTQPRTIRDKWYHIPTSGASEVIAAESTSIRAASGSANNMVTADDIKNKFLKGIDLTDENGEAMDDATIEKFIMTSVSTIERELRIDILQKKVISDPEEGEVYDIAESPYDYIMNDYLHWGFIKLFRKPTIRVDKIEFIYPTGVRIMTLPTEWVKLKPKHSQINIIPTAGTLSQVIVGHGGQFLPMLTAGYLGDVPGMVHIDYLTGFETIPDDIWSAIGKLASIEVLTIMSDAMAQGISNSSISADGLNLSYSRTNSPNAVLFQARIDVYNKWLENFYLDGYRNYQGIAMTIL